jgi:hypothetical protein
VDRRGQFLIYAPGFESFYPGRKFNTRVQNFTPEDENSQPGARLVVRNWPRLICRFRLQPVRPDWAKFQHLGSPLYQTYCNRDLVWIHFLILKRIHGSQNWVIFGTLCPFFMNISGHAACKHHPEFPSILNTWAVQKPNACFQRPMTDCIIWGQFLTSPLGVNFESQGWSWPLRVKLSPGVRTLCLPLHSPKH